MKATPEDVAKTWRSPRRLNQRPDKPLRLNEGHARRRGEVEVVGVTDELFAASMKATPEDVAKTSYAGVHAGNDP